MLAKSPDALRADFQRFYNLDLDEVGHTVRPMRAADLAAWLPDDARIWGQFDPRAQWGTMRQLVANVADSVNFLAWTKTNEAARKGARWKNQIQRPGTNQTPKTTITGTATTIDDLRRRLAMPRT
ncbi:DUF5361 domain-containing protein [Bifidobacterium amazonense]|uniref:DUF5361 domain-containing protein n=1 Tax=Bifidobacterium amazonense TaxID=2809027 RepID=A0ABS9VZ02_9BIFI|nr:DUF5361 domain-containing protein [Bifidobacterium amazonense]MCH9277204.1 DUF5361 domain-containing protein [Bifidobacterium amazonense]